MADHPYSNDYWPPAPLVPIRVSAPGSPSAVLLLALVDTGADLSVLPAVLTRDLGLRVSRPISVQGFGGVRRKTLLYGAEVQLGQVRAVLEVLGEGSEALIGRDLLGHLKVLLNGPASVLQVLA